MKAFPFEASRQRERYHEKDIVSFETLIPAAEAAATKQSCELGLAINIRECHANPPTQYLLVDLETFPS